MPQRKTQPAPPQPPVTPPDRPIDEAVLLGYLLLRAPHPDAIDIIRPALLSHVGHRIILGGIDQVRAGGTDPCPLSVSAALERAGDLEAAGGRGYLYSLIDGVVGGPTGWAMLAPYLDAVRGAARKRRLSLMASDLAAAATNGHGADELGEMAGAIATLAASGDEAAGLPWIDLTATPEPGKWLVRSIIPEQGRLLLVAPSGAGKSWMLLDLALAVALAEPWLGVDEYRVQGNRGPVLIVDEESSASRTRWRLSRLAAARGLTLADLVPTGPREPGLQVSCLAGVSLGDPTSWARLAAEVRRLRPCLVILDAAIRFIAGNENESQYVGPFWSAIGAIQVLGPAVAVAHHTGWVEKDRARGSTDWHGGADCVLTIRKTEERDRIKLSWTKMKDPPDYRDPEPIFVDILGREQVKLTSGGSAADDTPSGTDLDTAILEVISFAPEQTASRASILETFSKRGPATISRAIKRLKDAGKITSDHDGYSLP